MQSGSEAPIEASTTEVISVAVPGGALAVEYVTAGTGSAGPVLAIHGISSQRKLWNWLRAARPGLSLIAPDLRGRGDSASVTGTSSVARHAADMIAVLDHLGLDAVPVCGMSMGGFIAVELATSYPDRVTSLILVDGGFPMATPPGLTPEAVPAMFHDRLARLDRDWPSVGDYARFFVEQTAPLLDPADPLLLDYLAHDLAGPGGGEQIPPGGGEQTRPGEGEQTPQRVRLSADALGQDAVDIFFGPSKWEQIPVPTRLLTAQWSTGRDSAPAYPPAAIERFRGVLGPPGPLVTVQTVAGADHAAAIMSPAGARATAGLISEVL
jgi:pimeloyl-ACP methyl ester carboxylesterase